MVKRFAGFAPGTEEAGRQWSVAAGAWELNLRTGEQTISESIRALLGEDPTSARRVKASELMSLERVHPEDRPRLQRVLQLAIATRSEEVGDAEFRLRKADGGWVWLHTQSRIVDWFDDGRPARIVGWHTDISDRKAMESAVADITRKVEMLTGEAFFVSLAVSLASALNVRYCLIGRLTPGEHTRTIAFCAGGEIQPNFEYPLEASPCEQVLKAGDCYFAEGVASKFPDDAALKELGAESYMGRRLTSLDGTPIGLIVVSDDKPMPLNTLASTVFSLFAARASVEMERIITEEGRLATEKRYRLLFEQLISACALLEPVYRDGRVVDFRYLEVNPAFESVTGLEAHRVRGHTIREMVPGVEDYWIEAIAQVVYSGTPATIDQYSRDYDRWYELRAFQAAPERIAILFNDITERQCREVALRDSERTLRELFENSQLAAIVQDLNGKVIFCNDAALALVGRTEEEVRGADWLETFVYEDQRGGMEEALKGLAKGQDGHQRSWRSQVRHSSGSPRLVDWDLTPVYGSDGLLTSLASLGRDITEWAQLEEQCRQAQKMDAVGRLAGGIAHDFNNLLTVIAGYSGLAATKLPEKHAALSSLREVQKACDRAATLTRQLLAFSRKQWFQARILDLNELVSDAAGMLARLIDARIRLETQIEPNLGVVRSDPGQLLQVILNLAVNSRDAIRENGTITIGTSNYPISSSGDPAFPSAKAGSYVCMWVSDDGCGMDEEAQLHLFEPFYTTKAPGEGTGLGLATVYGIVKQSGGAISVKSAPGKGTICRILLPRATGAPEKTVEAPLPAVDRTTGEILLVEDQDAVRGFLRAVLEENGFNVVSAGDAEKAMDWLAMGLRPDLLISDVIMPGMSGPALAEQARKLVPDLKVVLVSGYAPSRERLECDAYLQKPFSGMKLLATIQPLMNASRVFTRGTGTD